MRIKRVTDACIEFDTGDILRSWHRPVCCEENFASFSELEDIARETEFQEPLLFEAVCGGFRCGNEGKMFFIPCYSEQNGCYTSDVDIEFNGKCVLTCQGTEVSV